MGKVSILVFNILRQQTNQLTVSKYRCMPYNEIQMKVDNYCKMAWKCPLRSSAHYEHFTNLGILQIVCQVPNLTRKVPMSTLTHVSVKVGGHSTGILWFKRFLRCSHVSSYNSLGHICTICKMYTI